MNTKESDSWDRGKTDPPDRPRDERRETRPDILSTRPPAISDFLPFDLQRITGGSFIIDASGTILAFDRQMERMTGWSAYEILGRHKDLGLFDEPDRRGQRRYLPRPLFEGRIPGPTGPDPVPLTMTCRDGMRLEVEVSVVPLGGENNRWGVDIKRVCGRLGPSPSSDSAEGTDPVTCLPGESLFDERLFSSFTVARETGHTLSLLLIDPDGFPDLERNYGKGSDTEVLRRLAGALQMAIRQTDLVARLEGPRFAVLLEGTGRGEARAVGGRLRRMIEKFPFVSPSGNPIPLTVSIGISCHPADGVNPQEMRRRAEEALEEAHRLGSNRVWCYVRRPRVPLRTPVFYEGAEGHQLGQSRDLSNSGIFVETPEEVVEGMRLGLSFRLPGQDHPVRVVGRVARKVMPPNSPSPGVGIEFEWYGDEDRSRLENFLFQSLA